jgi:hypothetical protein
MVAMSKKVEELQ